MTKGAFVWDLESRLVFKRALDAGNSIPEICDLLKLDIYTIKHEIERGGPGGKKKYDPYKAHSKYNSKRLPRTFTKEEFDFIVTSLKEGKSIIALRAELKCGFEKLRIFLHEKNLEPVRHQSNWTLTRRVNALEEQIKLIYDLIEGKL